jgi:hypothetical protein
MYDVQGAQMIADAGTGTKCIIHHAFNLMAVAETTHVI